MSAPTVTTTNRSVALWTAYGWATPSSVIVKRCTARARHDSGHVHDGEVERRVLGDRDGAVGDRRLGGGDVRVLVGPVGAVALGVVGELGEALEQLRVRVAVDRVRRGSRSRSRRVPRRGRGTCRSRRRARCRSAGRAARARRPGRVSANTLTSPSWSQWLFVTNSASTRASGWSRYANAISAERSRRSGSGRRHARPVREHERRCRAARSRRRPRAGRRGARRRRGSGACRRPYDLKSSAGQVSRCADRT